MSKVHIYTTPICPYCVRAKSLLKKKGAEIEEIDVFMDHDARVEMEAQAQGRRTVPQIFIGEKHVGGCDDLYALERAGELDPLLHKQMSAFRAACVQLRSSDDVAQNIEITSSLIREAHAKGAEFIATPENTTLMAPDGGAKLDRSFSEDADPALPAFRALAEELGMRGC